MSEYQQALIEAAQEFHAHEMDVGRDSRWARWCDKVERGLGLDPMPGLDGDEEVEGYSLDGAVDAYDAGMSVADYVAQVRAKQAALAKAVAA